MIYLVSAIHVVICLFLILVVLLQQGKGADLSVFGGGSTQAAFGARGAATLLHKLTVGAFIGFIFTTMGIGFLQSDGGGGSVMEAVETPAAGEVAAEPEETAPADAGAAPGEAESGEPAAGGEQTPPEGDGPTGGGPVGE